MISLCLQRLAYIHSIRTHGPVTTQTTGEQWLIKLAYWAEGAFPCKSSHSSLSHSPCRAHACKHAHKHACASVYWTELCRRYDEWGFLRKRSTTHFSALFFYVSPSSLTLCASAFVFWKSPHSLVFHESLWRISFKPLDRLSESTYSFISYRRNLKDLAMERSGKCLYSGGTFQKMDLGIGWDASDYSDNTQHGEK